MAFDLSNKNILITGAGSGIGEAIAKTLASQGAFIFVLEKDSISGIMTTKEIIKEGGRAEYVSADVTDLKNITLALREMEDKLPIDILINNAGIGHIGTAESTSPDDFDKIYNVNVKGYYHLLHATLPYMKERNRGNIINIASVAGTVGIADRFAYSVSKGAVLAMTRSVAKDYLRYGIRCNSISPGRVHTPFVDGYISKNYPGKEKEVFEQLSRTQPIGRMGQPDEIANLALYLSSDEASFVTGTDFPIDGGFIKLNS